MVEFMRCLRSRFAYFAARGELAAFALACAEARALREGLYVEWELVTLSPRTPAKEAPFVRGFVRRADRVVAATETMRADHAWHAQIRLIEARTMLEAFEADAREATRDARPKAFAAQLGLFDARPARTRTKRPRLRAV
jgi:hypothetical protein